MTLADTLSILQSVAKQLDLSQPYVVGGLPRNILLSKLNPQADPWGTSDVDITTGDDDVHALAKAFAARVGGELLPVEDHFKVRYRHRTFDFSKNLRYPDVIERLRNLGITNPTELQTETFSRDFTVNALLMTPDFDHVVDYTKRGMKDISNRVLSAPLGAVLSFQFDPKRLLRAYVFRAKYKLQFDEDLQAAVRSESYLLRRVNERYAAEQVNAALRADESLLEVMIADGILKRTPMTKLVKELLLKHKRLLEVI